MISSTVSRESAPRSFVKLASALTSEYCDNVDEELNKVAFIDHDQNMDEILHHFHQLNAKLKEKMYKEKAEEIFKCIPMKMEMFYERFDNECMKVPIFKYYDPFQMFQRISCASNEDIVTIKEKLLNRANLYSDKVAPELKNVKQIKQIIDDYTKSKDNSIKVVMLKDFSKALETMIEQYETNKK